MQNERKVVRMNDIEITKASEIKVREIEWLWYPYIPFGKITVVQGDAGDGKSTFVLNLAAMLSRGQPMPFTDGTGQAPINIIYQSSEDDADDTIVPRFISAGVTRNVCCSSARKSGICLSRMNG